MCIKNDSNEEIELENNFTFDQKQVKFSGKVWLGAEVLKEKRRKCNGIVTQSDDDNNNNVDVMITTGRGDTD